MKLLQKLAHKGGRTIICTIHQPRSDIFQMFDNIYMMVRGRVAYFGPLERISSYFRKIGYPIPSDMNPADFIIDLTHDDPKNESSTSLHNERATSWEEIMSPKVNLEIPLEESTPELVVVGSSVGHPFSKLIINESHARRMQNR